MTDPGDQIESFFKFPYRRIGKKGEGREEVLNAFSGWSKPKQKYFKTGW